MSVTDLNVVLGRLNPDYFLGGDIKLDPERARHEVERQVAEPLGLDVEQAAAGVIELFEETLKNEAVGRILGKGYSPADYALLCYGGGGPLHVAGYTAGVAYRDVLVPAWAAGFSAFGCACADFEYRYDQTIDMPIMPTADEMEKAGVGVMITGAWLGLQERVVEEFAKSGIEADQIELHPRRAHAVLRPAQRHRDRLAAHGDGRGRARGRPDRRVRGGLRARSTRAPPARPSSATWSRRRSCTARSRSRSRRCPSSPRSAGSTRPARRAARRVVDRRLRGDADLRARGRPGGADRRGTRRPRVAGRRPSRSRPGGRHGSTAIRSSTWRLKRASMAVVAQHDGIWSRARARRSAGTARPLHEMLDESERLIAETGSYYGLSGDLPLQSSDPIGYEKLFSRLRGGLVSARETALNISASPIVRELGELCFALYTPEGDSIALSTGIIVHVHTMSDAIKYMVRSDYEDNPEDPAGRHLRQQRPGDRRRAQRRRPDLRADLLGGRAGRPGPAASRTCSTSAPRRPAACRSARPTGSTTASTCPASRSARTTSWPAGTCTRCEKQTRAPMYYLLDEKTRLAGCHMIREAVERVILEEGIDRFKEFTREVIEEGRRSFKSRIREMTVPGRYRSPSFWEITFADKEQLPARARVDTCMHSAWEVRIGGDGEYALDMDGTSAWGYHSMNCTPSGMQGAIWVMFTQTLICSDKVNDGAYLAVETNFPEGSIANLGEAEGSTGIAWAFLQPAFTGYPRTLSRALQARGFIEEVISAYSVSGNVQQGGGIDQYGNSSAIMNFEVAAQGMGAKYVLDGTDTCAAMFNPEGDMGDVEMWELISPFVYLSRKAKASTAGPGPPPRRLELRVAVHGLEHALLGAPEPRHQQAVLGLRPVRRLSRQRRLHPQHQGRRPDRAGAARRGVPDRRRRLREPRPDGDRGRARVQARRLHHALPVRERRPLPVGDEGRRRPGRPAAAARSRRSRPTCATSTCCRASRSRSTAVSDREAARARRLERGTAGERVVGRGARAGARTGRDRAAQADVRGVVPALAALRRRVPRLLGSRRGLRLAGATRPPWPRPAPSGARSRRRRPPPSSSRAPTRPVASRREPGRTRAREGDARAICSTRSSSGGRSRTSSPATRIRIASTSGSPCSRSACRTTTRSCCPCGEGLNIVRRGRRSS